MNHRRRRLWALAPLLMVIGLGLAGCGSSRTATEPVQPAQIKPVPGSGLHFVTLTRQAMLDLGIRTQPVRRAPSPSATASPGSGAKALTVIPLTAVIYDSEGRSWTYTVAAPRTFVRKAIVIERINGDEVLLRSGPAAGTPVVTVGAPELLGAEYGVGRE